MAIAVDCVAVLEASYMAIALDCVAVLEASYMAIALNCSGGQLHGNCSHQAHGQGNETLTFMQGNTTVSAVCKPGSATYSVSGLVDGAAQTEAVPHFDLTYCIVPKQKFCPVSLDQRPTQWQQQNCITSTPI